LYYTRRTLCDEETAGTPTTVQKHTYFLLVDRGGCSFVEKVRNAQKDNITAVLIADDRCLCSGTSATVCQSDQPCEDSEPVMDDDGTGSDIRIPSMLVLKTEADRLKNALLGGNQVQLQLSWPIPKAVNGIAEYTLWMTPDDQTTHHFLYSFLEAASELGDRAVFRPRMFLHDGSLKGCRRYGNSQDPCPGSCTNFGRYCAARTVDDDINTYENRGTLVVVESLRRSCIWKVYGEPNGIGYEWWSYVKSWISRCGNSQFSTSCAESLYETSGIDRREVEQCMLDSGNFRNNTSNTFLEDSLEEAYDFDVSFSPTLFVNDVVVRGGLTFGNVLEAICMTYEENYIPRICFEWETCSQMCGEDQICVLRNGECIVNEVPTYDQFETAWDDDYLTKSWLTSETTMPTIPPTLAPTVKPTVMTTSPTVAPVQVVTASPTVTPTVPPVPVPVASPTPVPTKADREPEKSSPTKEKEEGWSETIEIIEGNKENENGDIGFAAGLGAGLGAAAFVVFLVCMTIRVRRRNVLREAHEHVYGSRPRRRPYFEDDLLDDLPEDDYEEYDESMLFGHPQRSSRGGRIWYPQRIRMPRLPRRFIRRSRQKSSTTATNTAAVDFHRKRSLHFPEEDLEEEEAIVRLPRVSFRSPTYPSRQYDDEMLDADDGSSSNEGY